MTAVAAADASMPEAKPRARRRSALGDDVALTVSGLQRRLLVPKPHQEAVAALARLRRGIGREPGFDYALDGYLGLTDEQLKKIGDLVPSDGSPTDAEHAKHAAVTLYALHQQSQRDPMHADGRGFGRAVRELSSVSRGPDGIRRRFAALGTAISFDEGLYHLRSLIVMLREHRIRLDYGLLADDLRRLRRPDMREKVQADWGREFYRSRPATTESDTETDTDEEISE